MKVSLKRSKIFPYSSSLSFRGNTSHCFKTVILNRLEQTDLGLNLDHLTAIARKFGQILIIFQNDNKNGFYFWHILQCVNAVSVTSFVTNGLLVLNCYYRGTSQLSNTLKVSSSSLHFGLKENIFWGKD